MQGLSVIWSSVMVELSIAVEWGNQRVQIELVIVCLLINSSGIMGDTGKALVGYHPLRYLLQKSTAR